VFTGELILTDSDLKTEIGLKYLFSKLAYIFLVIKTVERLCGKRLSICI